MKESVTYQAIRDEGRVDEAWRSILRVGSKRFGVAPPSAAIRIGAIESIERLELLLDRALDVETWDELLRDS